MKVLILGASGMIGNGVFTVMSRGRIPVIGTVSEISRLRRLPSAQVIPFRIGDRPVSEVKHIIKLVEPTHIVNCIGMIKPTDDLATIKRLYCVNSVFPQVLSRVCDEYNIRLLHMSTDCVFSGERGAYTESDIPDDTSEYGRSKFLGEVVRSPHLTIRTSVIGRELGTHKNLLDWFLNTSALSVSGFSRAMWNGVSSLSLGRVVEKIIYKQLYMETPLIHVSGETVSKYELLSLFRRIFHKTIVIRKNTTYVNDRTLVPNNQQRTYFQRFIPPIKEQILELERVYGGA